MALSLTRLAAHKQLTTCYFRGLYLPTSRLVSLRAEPVQPPKSESFDERNARLKRPQSPHITIFKFELPAIMSITHRATGMALGGYLTVLGLGALVSPVDFPVIAESLANAHLSSALVVPIKALVAFPAAYHFVNGIRHLVWDTGRFLTIKQVYTTGYTAFAISLLFTAWLVTL